MNGAAPIIPDVRVEPDPSLVVRQLGRVAYEPTWRAMQAFAAQRSAGTADELWLLEHPPVYTLGQAGKREHLIAATDIPVVPIDRGGQITYHGPGQVVAYVLVDLRRRGYGIRELVARLEQAVIDLLAASNVEATRRAGAPGVYVDGAKIAALGLRVKHGCTYHGLAFNVDMDLEPFAAINPCGYPGMAVTQCRDLGLNWSVEQTERALTDALQRAIYS
ncbi:Lipoate-protein ligase B [Thiobacillus denitrificans ATCC 25259]|uniref:Octanoyltransferase n=1 Tax=Thiobacillus denitrificans (strain ATCC 25259 / T1) TaxID=292415 RepID=LIPB_THIDA|nr:lipoyl(octanoyl) transferase LipB [Thiobacillus denitrificans]Q3SM28.1 RecName: Full=Octanoyltransferase; AltName: Full=Lipoate-protein ligase B; AltName: Full=Lipoyl/octanoyl transferase; AltName: Full=Octanoyl-[acyl-carrier-protein]-protein N-octanoyltransferase [Thiobacillus denitrificans ATCC 25259]AAZ96222.1 Lipoate-protein ligase B [Thiobacillus denitrificans ATCC 25259]